MSNPIKNTKDVGIMGKYGENNYYKNIFMRMEEKNKDNKEGDEEFEDIEDEEEEL